MEPEEEEEEDEAAVGELNGEENDTPANVDDRFNVGIVSVAATGDCGLFAADGVPAASALRFCAEKLLSNLRFFREEEEGESCEEEGKDEEDDEDDDDEAAV